MRLYGCLSLSRNPSAIFWWWYSLWEWWLHWNKQISGHRHPLPCSNWFLQFRYFMYRNANKKLNHQQMIGNGIRDCISSNALEVFPLCSPHGQFTCMQPNPADTWLVYTTQTTNGLQMETRTLLVPKSCSVAHRCCIQMLTGINMVEIRHFQFTASLYMLCTF